MKEYAQEDFISYYNLSFVRNPANITEVGQLVGSRRGGPCKFNTRFDNINHNQLEECPEIDWKLLEWEHVKRPQLGYRHFENGRYLINSYVDRQERVPKGLHRHCVGFEVPIEMQMAINGLPANMRYNPNKSLTLEVARELCYPNFLTMRAAVKQLKENAIALGFAINHDCAVILGTTDKAAFLLLFKGIEIASSMDGVKWNCHFEEFEGVVERYAK